MKTYKITFKGRLNGAIGITYGCEAVVVAENEKEARLVLYDDYEHIRIRSIREVEHEKTQKTLVYRTIKHKWNIHSSNALC